MLSILIIIIIQPRDQILENWVSLISGIACNKQKSAFFNHVDHLACKKLMEGFYWFLRPGIILIMYHWLCIIWMAI